MLQHLPAALKHHLREANITDDNVSSVSVKLQERVANIISYLQLVLQERGFRLLICCFSCSFLPNRIFSLQTENQIGFPNPESFARKPGSCLGNELYVGVYP